MSTSIATRFGLGVGVGVGSGVGVGVAPGAGVTGTGVISGVGRRVLGRLGDAHRGDRGSVRRRTREEPVDPAEDGLPALPRPERVGRDRECPDAAEHERQHHDADHGAA